MRTTDLLALALALPFAAGCGGGGGSTDIESTLVFADRSDLEISRLINAAGGTDMFGAEAQIDQFGDTFDPDPCPAITIDGNTATVTGGCTTADGVMIGGSATATNPFGWDQIDTQYGDAADYEMTALSFTQSGFTQTYDGFIHLAGDHTTWDADITATDGQGVAVRSDIYYHCSGSIDSLSCNVSGSGLELVGVGGATLSGGIHGSADSNTTDYTLKGVDTLKVNIISNATTHCVGWTIEGTDRGMPCP